MKTLQDMADARETWKANPSAAAAASAALVYESALRADERNCVVSMLCTWLPGGPHSDDVKAFQARVFDIIKAMDE